MHALVHPIDPICICAGNTVSNLAMIIPPMFGVYRCQRSRLEARYTLSYLGLLGRRLYVVACDRGCDNVLVAKTLYVV